MKKLPVPVDFDSFVKAAKSRNEIVKKYNVAPTVIDRWIKESNLNIDVRDLDSNKKKDKEEKTKKNPSPGKKIILEILEQVKTLEKVCSYFDITRPVLNRWLREEKIELPAYFGRLKKFNSYHENEEFIKYCNSHNLSQVRRHFRTNTSTLQRLCSENEINLPKSAFWKSEIYRNKTKELFNEIIRLNEIEKKNLLEISTELDIPLSFIKKEIIDQNYNVKIFSYNKSKGENEIKDFISKELNFSCYSIKPKFNEIRLEIDCFIEDKKVGIEYCGEYWHSTLRTEDKLYHQKKTHWAKEQEISLLTIFEHEWIQKKEIVKSIISNKLGVINKKIFARKTNIIEIDSNAAKEFHINNHIQGWVASKINIGLVSKIDNELLAVMSFSKPRFNKGFEYEITRFSNKLNCVVVGGASKLFSYFTKIFGPKSVISYADLRFGTGDVYSKLGFELKRITPPNYWYFNKKTSMLENRLKFQKHKLETILDDFDPNETEVVNMNRNGYFQIFDCGNNVYEYF